MAYTGDVGAICLKGHALANEKDGLTAVESPVDRKNRQLAEGHQARAEYAARAAQIDKNTARLRALRLAKEAADREHARLNPPPPTPPKKKRSKSVAK
jgi:hypothetical protein